MTNNNEEIYRYLPKQSESFNGKGDYITVATWIFGMLQYFLLFSSFNPDLLAAEKYNIDFASCFLSDSASVWWYTIIQSAPSWTIWSDFFETLKSEWAPMDYLLGVRDLFRRLKPAVSVLCNVC